MGFLLRLFGLASVALIASVHAAEIPIIPRLAGRIQMPERKVAEYFSETLILKRPLGDLQEWTGKFDVEEGDSDWNSWVQIRFEQGTDERTGKRTWRASGVFLDGWDESKAVSFAHMPVLMLDEDGSAFFKIGKRRCYLFRHTTRGCILVIESGFYEKVH